MTYAKRTDSNQVEIVKTFRQMGCSVAITSGVGRGFPDCVVGCVGKNLLVEIKDGEKYASQQKLTSEEAMFHLHWLGQVCVVRSVEEAEALIKKTREG